MDMFRSYLLTVLCLTETWHDADSPVFGRCRASGFPVIDRPRPRVRDDLSVNHGGVAILAARPRVRHCRGFLSTRRRPHLRSSPAM